jgi:hypothetical protein
MNNLIKHSVNRIHQYKVDRSCNRKISTIKKSLPKLRGCGAEIEQEYLEKWSKLGKKPDITFLRTMCAVSGIKSSSFVPENIHYNRIEPILNNRIYAPIFNDKNFYERYFLDYPKLFPEAILRCISNVFYTKDFRHIHDAEVFKILDNIDSDQDLIIKQATETGGGVSVVLVTKKKKKFLIGDKSLDYNEFLKWVFKTYNNSYIIQKKIVQHPILQAFNATSLNILRVYTYRSVNDESINFLHSYLRYGKPGSITDGIRSGGSTIGISSTGVINDFAITKYGERILESDALLKYKGSRIPLFDEIINVIQDMAPRFPYHRLLGFDFTVDVNNQLKLLEVNNLFIGVINQQMNTGPLFGKFTDEVVDFCSTRKKAVSFHYYI